MNHYTHSTLSHLGNNLGLYLLSMFAIFNIETNKRRFHIVSIVLFILLPIAMSLMMVKYFSVLPPLQGFSAISSGFVGYFVYAFYSYLRMNFAFIGSTFLLIILIVNLLLTVISNDYGFETTAVLFLVLGFLLVNGREDLRMLSKTFLNIIGKRSRENYLLSIYNSLVFSACLTLIFALPFLVPSIFVRDGVITNILGHYIGWISGVFTPWIFDMFKR